MTSMERLSPWAAQSGGEVAFHVDHHGDTEEWTVIASRRDEIRFEFRGSAYDQQHAAAFAITRLLSVEEDVAS
jgi:hypothetical protein